MVRACLGPILITQRPENHSDATHAIGKDITCFLNFFLQLSVHVRFVLFYRRTFNFDV